jgi:hypothetical protein
MNKWVFHQTVKKQNYILMKTIKIFKCALAGMLLLLFAVACNQGIDPLTPTDPGSDASSPVVTIKYPTDGVKIEVPELLASIKIQFEVTDDIEIKTISLLLDGTVLANYSSFKDYRRAITEFQYDKVTTGNHTLTVQATDLQGKVTIKSVKFEKKPPYTAVFPGEIFFMPFDGDYVEKISFKAATVVGSPGFAGSSLKGLNAYKGAADSYITFPAASLKNTEFTAAFWYKANASPDRSGVISISPVGEDRTKGLRFFREGSATSQRFKLNVGTGSGETWNDGGTIVAPGKDWVHLAFTVSATECTVYINGAAAATVNSSPINWTGCDNISIASGAPNFAYWDHKSDNSYYDELRIFNKSLTSSEIQNIIQYDSPYLPKYSGEVFYMPFEGNYKEYNSNVAAAKVGSPLFAAGKIGQAYAGATDSYVTFPAANLTKTTEVSAVFWMKVNSSPDRAGILTLGPEDKTNPGYPSSQNLRTSGYRFFREGSATSQQFKVNVGTGTGESWNDGGIITPITGEWVHMAFTVSGTKSIIYINGELARESTLTAINWTGCDLLSIMSGIPRFTEWNHKSDLSLMDELRLFNKSLTQAEIQTIFNAEK